MTQARFGDLDGCRTTAKVRSSRHPGLSSGCGTGVRGAGAHDERGRSRPVRPCGTTATVTMTFADGAAVTGPESRDRCRTGPGDAPPPGLLTGQGTAAPLPFRTLVRADRKSPAALTEKPVPQCRTSRTGSAAGPRTRIRRPRTWNFPVISARPKRPGDRERSIRTAYGISSRANSGRVLDEHFQVFTLERSRVIA